MLHALMIGIDRFEDPQIRNLRYARRDAEAVAGLLERIAPDERSLRLLVDAQATRLAVLKAMDDLAGAARSGDVVLVYIASHGTPEKRSPAREPSAFLVVHDTEYAYIHATSIGLECQVVDWMKRFAKASVVVVILDTCFSGEAGGRTFGRPMSGEPLSLKEIELGEGRVILTAADGKEVAFEDEDLEHGVFTHHLLEALQPPAGGPAAIGIGSLYDQVARGVQRETGGRQHPIQSGWSNLAVLPVFPR